MSAPRECVFRLKTRRGVFRFARPVAIVLAIAVPTQAIPVVPSAHSVGAQCELKDDIRGEFGRGSRERATRCQPTLVLDSATETDEGARDAERLASGG